MREKDAQEQYDSTSLSLKKYFRKIIFIYSICIFVCVKNVNVWVPTDEVLDIASH
jgi:hypothetical protein